MTSERERRANRHAVFELQPRVRLRRPRRHFLSCFRASEPGRIKHIIMHIISILLAYIISISLAQVPQVTRRGPTVCVRCSGPRSARRAASGARAIRGARAAAGPLDLIDLFHDLFALSYRAPRAALPDPPPARVQFFLFPGFCPVVLGSRSRRACDGPRIFPRIAHGPPPRSGRDRTAYPERPPHHPGPRTPRAAPVQPLAIP